MFEMPEFGVKYNETGERLLPHRAPFLFVDRLISADPTGAVGEYTFTLGKNDFFKGHFPDFPVVPGVVLIEAMSQVAGAAVTARKLIDGQVSFALASIEQAKFRHPIRPGDKLVSVVEIVRERKPRGVYRIKGYLNGEPDEKGFPACECEVKCFLGESTLGGKGEAK